MSTSKPTTPPESALQDQFDLLSQQQAQLKALLLQEQTELKRLGRRLWTQQEAERAALARELHDGVGQLLTGLTRQLTEQSAGQPALQPLAELASQALADVRQLSRLMRPAILDDLGLEAAIRWLCRTLFTHADTQCNLSFSALDKVPEESAILVFRIAQEALTNCLKHANASQVDLYLGQGEGVLRMDIVDNGCGFDPATVQGLGLVNMNDRAKAFDAKWQVASRPGRGCHLSLVVKL
ncbi:sensor histidine kinase [Aliiglaciecola sp. CAU 1673]|uniref:sensor histidine kinase n=1 Tax=Aliiglaciecola sp. CAU 1673 TaxID=3032595 RepID=UPI0023DA5308|nr:sensor histidine kinase [Aliiglaciecola sp. CAU 1673]MDF2178159.1 sensor histidine kinase [Aliiglaciecola sp. CAU 1673]